MAEWMVYPTMLVFLQCPYKDYHDTEKTYAEIYWVYFWSCLEMVLIRSIIEIVFIKVEKLQNLA